MAYLKAGFFFILFFHIATELHTTSFAIKSVTVVAPGLNVRPSAMGGLIRILNKLGSDACLVHFSKMQHPLVKADVLEEDVLEAYVMARSIAEKHAVPVYFLGYSLGALICQYLLCQGPGNIKFDKQVLIAPATAIKLPSFVKLSVSLLNDNLKIKSYAPVAYRVDKWLPAKMYKQMMFWERSILKARFEHANIPTLLIIDPKDELISYSTLIRQIKKFRLTNYQRINLDSNLRGRNSRYHHLVIDEATMGKKNWFHVTNAMNLFLSH